MHTPRQNVFFCADLMNAISAGVKGTKKTFYIDWFHTLAHAKTLKYSLSAKKRLLRSKKFHLLYMYFSQCKIIKKKIELK